MKNLTNNVKIKKNIKSTEENNISCSFKYIFEIIS